MLTRCPACGTTYRVSPEQIRARQGKVRCGRCHTIFDALESLVDVGLQQGRPGGSGSDDGTEPIIQAPMPPRSKAPTARAERTPAPERANATEVPRERKDPWTEPVLPAGDLDALLAETHDITPSRWSPLTSEVDEDDIATKTGDERDSELPNFSTPASSRPVFAPEPPLASLPAPDDDHEQAAPGLPPKRPLWPAVLYGFLASLLIIGLLVQVALHFRAELAVRSPTLKPVLQALCDTVGCRIELPRFPEQITLEGQQLASDPAKPGQLTLSATLGNKATLPQAYPHIELTLLSATGKPVVRRVFSPTDYLTAETPAEKGFAPGSELPFTIQLETRDVSATDYRVGAFFP